MNSSYNSTSYQFNVYHFGDSYSDPGNMPYMSFDYQMNQSSDIKLPNNQIMQTRFTNGINCDGQNFPFFVAREMNFKMIKAKDIDQLPSNKGYYINFAMSGAGQIYNTGIRLNAGLNVN